MFLPHEGQAIGAGREEARSSGSYNGQKIATKPQSRRSTHARKPRSETGLWADLRLSLLAACRSASAQQVHDLMQDRNENGHPVGVIISRWLCVGAISHFAPSRFIGPRRSEHRFLEGHVPIVQQIVQVRYQQPAKSQPLTALTHRWNQALQHRYGKSRSRRDGWPFEFSVSPDCKVACPVPHSFRLRFRNPRLTNGLSRGACLWRARKCWPIREDATQPCALEWSQDSHRCMLLGERREGGPLRPAYAPPPAKRTIPPFLPR